MLAIFYHSALSHIPEDSTFLMLRSLYCMVPVLSVTLIELAIVAVSYPKYLHDHDRIKDSGFVSMRYSLSKKLINSLKSFYSHMNNILLKYYTWELIRSYLKSGMNLTCSL
jgi:hypothetical protein